jgi:hypothetical protein
MRRPLSGFSGRAESFYYTAGVAARGANRGGGAEACSLDGVRGERSSAVSAPTPSPMNRKVIAVGGSYRSGRNIMACLAREEGGVPKTQLPTPARLVRRELTAGKMLAVGGRQERSTQRISILQATCQRKSESCTVRKRFKRREVGNCLQGSRMLL